MDKEVIKKIIKETVIFFMFLVLGTLITVPLSRWLGLLEKYQGFMDLLKENSGTYFLIMIPYFIFIIIRIINVFILKDSLEFTLKKKIITLITREIFYLISFFVVGFIFMPWMGKILGIINYKLEVVSALFGLEPSVYILVLVPYFIFILIRLILYYLRNLWLKEKYECDYGYRNTYDLSDFKGIILVVTVLFVLSFVLYVFSPKPVYREFYGRKKICDCIGYKKTIQPTQLFWGEKNEDWGVCFGLLKNCE